MDKEIFFYNTSDNIKLCGEMKRCNDGEDIVIICHARGSSKNSITTTTIQDELAKNNINSFKFDFRGHGNSREGVEDRDELTSNFKRDLEDTIIMLNSKGYKNIHLLGTSMGGKIVSLVDFSKFAIKSITLWYPAMLNFKNSIDVKLNKIFKTEHEKDALANGYTKVPSTTHLVSSEYFEDDRKYIPIKNLKTATCPILILHGTKDEYVDYKDSEYVYKRIKAKNKNTLFYPIENGTHKFTGNEMKKAISITTYFISEILSKELDKNKIK